MSKLAAVTFILCLVAGVASATTNIGALEPAAGTWRAYRGAGWTTHVCTANSERAVLDCAAADAERRVTTTRYQIRYPNRYATVTFTATRPPEPPQPEPPTPQPPASGNWLFRDQFEYDAARNGSPVDQLFTQRGWTGIKANNASAGRGSGFIYTRHDATRGSRVLVLESRPQDLPPPAGFPYNQTDYYLQLGREGSSAESLPANVWIQFATYATPESRFSTRDKAIYPCSSFYPCTWGPNLGWLLMWGSGGFNTGGDGSSRRFLAMEAWNADYRADPEYPTNKVKLFQNVNTTPMQGGVWYDVRLHLDTSGAQGVYEAWTRRQGGNWIKVSDWRGGVTPNFSWSIPTNQRRGHAMVRIPTTVNQHNNTVYIDDLVIAASEAELP